MRVVFNKTNAKELLSLLLSIKGNFSNLKLKCARKLRECGAPQYRGKEGKVTEKANLICFLARSTLLFFLLCYILIQFFPPLLDSLVKSAIATTGNSTINSFKCLQIEFDILMHLLIWCQTLFFLIFYTRF